jgi:hypothetical protein
MGNVRTAAARNAPRVWLGVAVALWAVLLVAAAVYGAHVGRPTVREQTTIVAAIPTVDRALATVVGAVTGSQAVVSVSGYERTQAGCDAGNRDGERYERSVQVYVAPGQEAGLLDRVAAALPTSYNATVRHAAGVHGLRADAGYFVVLSGAVSRPGEVRFVADTGCRALGGSVPVAAEQGGPAATQTSATATLTRLRAVRSRQQVNELACPSGGRLATVAVIGAAPSSPEAAKPTSALAGAVPTGVTALISGDDLLAYVDQGVGVSVTVKGADVTVTATAGCQ